MNFIIFIIGSILACSPQQSQNISLNDEKSHIICKVEVPIKITNSIRDIISNRLISLHYTGLECLVSEGEGKNQLQWKGANSKFSNPLPKGAIIQNFSISFFLGNNISPSLALIPVVESVEIPSLVFVNEPPTKFLRKDVEKISYQIVDGNSEQVELSIYFSCSGQQKMKDMNKNFIENCMNYIIVYFPSGYTRRYNYLVKSKNVVSFRAPYTETLLLLAYFKYPIPNFYPDDN